MSQELKGRLYPETGVELSGRFGKQKVENIISRTWSALFGFSAGKLVALECTSTGVLKTAETGSGLETYATYTGTTVDAYAAGQTHEYAGGADKVDVLVETNDIKASFKDVLGAWGDDISIPVGSYTHEVVSYGVKFKARVSSSQGVYQAITAT